MKSLKEVINESQEQIDENLIATGNPVIDSILLTLNIGGIIMFFGALLGDGGTSNRHPFDGFFGILTQAFRRIKNDIKFKKTVERLLQDQEIIDFLNLPDRKRTGAKWQELLQSKLTEDELEWSNVITNKVADKGNFHDNMKHTFYKKADNKKFA